MNYILSRAPHRISLGSSADTMYFLNLVDWGNALSFAISRYAYCLVTPNPGGFYLNSNMAAGKFYDDLDEISNGSERPIGILENAIRYFVEHFGLEKTLESMGIKGLTITTTTDVPPESGLGGSASTTVAVILALSRLTEITLERYQIAQLAYSIERSKEYMGIPGGIQDQVSAVYGGFNYMTFKRGEKNEIDFDVHPITTGVFLENLLLIRIPRERDGKDVHNLQREKSETEPDRVRKLLGQKRSNLIRMYDNIYNGLEFWEELSEDNRIKGLLGDVQTQTTQKIFETALRNGALGGRIIGAGKGGCIIFYCRDKSGVLRSLEPYGVLKIDFNIDKEGAKIIGEG